MSLEKLAAHLKQTPQALVAQADVHTRTVQAWLASQAPRAARFAGIGVHASSTGYPVPLLNLALSQPYPENTPVALISKEIEQIKAFFRTRNVPWYWWLGPQPAPANMAVHLVRQGLRYDQDPLPTMLAPLPAQPVAAPADIQVWQASTIDDLQAASTIRHLAFGFPAKAAATYFEAMAPAWLTSPTVQLFLASKGEAPPAAMGALIIRAGIPGVYVMATLPTWNRQGLGKAILTRLLSEATEAGFPFVVLTASPLGYPLYQQFGFEEIFTYALYYLA